MKGWCGSIMASFALYKAREEIINKRKKQWIGEVWPKEMQVITLVSASYMKKLQEDYKECLNLQRDILTKEHVPLMS